MRNMTSFPFVKMAAATAKYHYGFVFVDVTAFRRPKSITNQISSTYVNWRLRYNYLRLNTTSGFVGLSVNVTAFRRSQSINTPNFVEISNGGWDITTSGFEIQTSAILKFYFRFRSRLFPRNRRVILHPAAEFRPNRNIHRWIMTSYRFSRWRPRPLNTTSGFVFVDVTAFRRSKSISKPNFVDISQLAAEI